MKLIIVALVAGAVGIVVSAESRDDHFFGNKTVDAVAVDVTGISNGEPSVGSFDAVADVYLPKDLDLGREYPLVLMLHGYSGSADNYREHFGMGKTDAIEVYVDGREDLQGWRYWNAFGPDWSGSCGGFENCGDYDVEYLRRVVAAVVSSHNVDESRIYVMGHSNGAAMALRLACDAADVFAAAVSIEGAPPTSDRVYEGYECSPSEPIGVLQIGGTQDGVVLYGGRKGGNKSYLGSAATIEYFASISGCRKTNLPSSSFSTGKWKSGFKKKINISSKVPRKETVVYRLGSGCAGNVKHELWKMVGENHGPKINRRFQRNVEKFLLKHSK